MRIESILKTTNWVCENTRAGEIFTDNLSKELDSATIVCPMVNQMNVEPYDVVKVSMTGFTRYYLVASYTKAYVSFNPAKFDYTLNLMSLTKLLETVLLPSMTVTNIGQNRTIGYYVRKVVSHYFKYDGQTVSTYNFPDGFENVVCPEFTLTNPTLREYLDNLYSYKGFIVTLDYDANGFKLSYLNPNASTGVMPTDTITTLEEGNTANDYVTNLVSDVENAISQTTLTENIEFRSTEYAFTSDNATLNLSHRIYDIKSIKLKSMSLIIATDYSSSDEFVYDGDNTELIATDIVKTISNVDITDFVVPKDVYDSFQKVNYASIEAPGGSNYLNSLLTDGNKYADMHAYYERGKTEICSLLERITKKFLLTVTYPSAIGYIVAKYLSEHPSANVSNNSFAYYFNYCKTYPNGNLLKNMTLSDIRNLQFEVEYVPYIDLKLDIEQSKAHTHNITMNNNTTDASVNLPVFVKKSIDDVNQLGNDKLGLCAYATRSTANLNKYKIGQKFGDYIVTQIEKSIQPNIILFKGVLSKYFTNKNIYTTLDRTKRYTSLANSEIVTRNEIAKKNITIKIKNDTTYRMKDGIVNAFKLGKYAIVHSITPLTSFATYTTCVASGNMLIYNIDIPNNNYCAIVNGEMDGNYQLTKHLMYVDSNGETEKVLVELFEKPTSTDANFVKSFPIVNSYTQGTNRIAVNKNNGDTIDISTDLIVYDILKDARERLCLTQEIIFKGGNNVEVGEGFAEALANGFSNLSFFPYNRQSSNVGKAAYMTLASNYIAVYKKNDSNQYVYNNDPFSLYDAKDRLVLRADFEGNGNILVATLD